jgi:two-component system response regulator MtrA
MDLGAPLVAGRQICRTLRRDAVNRRVPIVMIASRNAEADALTEIEQGADDFLVRPFGTGELSARARAAIHRARASRAGAAGTPAWLSATPAIRQGDIQIDPSRRHVQVKDRPVKLTEQEFQLLYVLATNAGVVFSREGLLSEIWGRDRFVTVRSVDTLVSRLRRRIEPGEQMRPRYLHTVRGVGYKLGDASEA